MDAMKSEIIFDPHKCKSNDDLMPFPEQFERIRKGWCVLIDHAFMLGRRNPFAPELMVEVPGGFQVSDELSEVDGFDEAVTTLDTLSNDFADDLQQVWNMGADAVEAIGDAEEPKDLVWQIIELQRLLDQQKCLLDQEKAWNGQLQQENIKLKAQVEELTPVKRNPLSESIAQILPIKAEGQ